MNAAQSTSSPAGSRPDPDRAEAEQAGRMLDRLAEMAMERAEAMHKAALAAIEAGDTGAVKDLELSLERAGRGVRRTLAAKLHFARKRQELAKTAEDAARGRAEAKAQRRQQVARAVRGSIAGDRGLDAGRAEALAAELWERLVEDDGIDAALELGDCPLEEIVCRICRDLGIRPDPAWLNPGYSGADWSSGRRPAAAPGGRPEPGDEPEDEPEDEAEDGSEDDVGDRPESGEPADPVCWPAEGPEAGRYWLLKKSGTDAGWYDIETGRRLDRPPWERKPDG